MLQMKNLIGYLTRFKIYVSNSAWVFAGLVVRMLITIFIVSRIANKIGTEDFGWYNYAISFFTILFAISTLGLNQSFLIKHFVNDDKDVPRILGTSIIGRVLFSSILLGSFALWIIWSNADPNYWVVLIAGSCVVFQVSDLFVGYYQWKLKANIYITVNIVSICIVAILLIIGLYLNYGLFYFISIYALERVLILLGLMITFHLNDIKLQKLSFDFKLFKSLFKYSWPLMLGAVLTAVYARFDQFLIKQFINMEAIGIYGTGIILSQIWYVVPSLIIPILYPTIAEKKKNNEMIKYYRLIKTLYSVLNYAALLIILFMYLFGELIIIELYGESYRDSIIVLYILIWNLVILFQSHLTTSVMIIEGREKYLFNIKLAGVVVNIVLNIIFLAKYGIIFAAYSLLISSFVSWILSSIFDSKMRHLMKLNLSSYLLIFKIKKYLV